MVFILVAVRWRGRSIPSVISSGPLCWSFMYCATTIHESELCVGVNWSSPRLHNHTRTRVTALAERLRAMSMLRARSSRALRFLRSSSSSSHQPNAPLDIDKSFRAILRDIDDSIAEQKLNRHHSVPTHELTAYPTDPETTQLAYQEDEQTTRAQRKSPAAHFGSQRLGAVVIPQELKQTISALISGENVTVIAVLSVYLQCLDSDRHLLRRDAVRLFSEHGDDDNWDPSLNVRYKSHKQERRHAERDGTAFISVVLPAHYSAIYAVLHHVKLRLGPQWSVQNVLDWGAGSGSALW